MTAPSPGVWIGLDQLLSLPLPAEALANLWRELLRSLPPEPSQERQALQQALLSHDLTRVEGLCRAGRIAAGLDLLEGLAPSVDPESLAAFLLPLMPLIHHTLVAEAGPDPDPALVADPQRAEALWHADRWMRRLEALPHVPSPLERLQAEQLCRYAVVAWTARSGDAARWRTLALLQRLLQLLPEASSWVVPAIRSYLQQGVEAILQENTLADPAHLTRLLEACEALEADPHLSDDACEALHLALYRGRAALTVWQKLEHLTPADP